MKKFIEPELLKDNCYVEREEEIRHDFSEEEIKLLKHELFDISARVSNRNKFKSLAADLMSESVEAELIIEKVRNYSFGNIGDIGLKQMKKDFANKLESIVQGYEIKMQTVYGFDDQEAGFMNFYTSDGHYCYQKPLTHLQKQLRIKGGMTAS